MEKLVQTVLPDISHGDHCCLIYSSPQDRLQLTAPFLALGLSRGERSVFVGGDDSVEPVREEMKRIGVDVDAQVRAKRLVFSSDREYLDDGRFNSDKMLSFLQQAYDSTLGEGFKALRAAGDVSWQVGPARDFRDVVYYETLLDVFFLGKRMVGLCEYSRPNCPPEIIAELLETHRIAAIDRDVCTNFHYVPPDLLLEKDTIVRRSRRAEWMTAQLLRARKAEEEVLRLNSELEERVERRTAELAAANEELEAFSYSVSHDLRSPLRTIDGFSQMLLEDQSDLLGDEGRRRLQSILNGARKMNGLIDDLLKFSRLGRAALAMQEVDMTALAQSAATEALAADAGRRVQIDPLPAAWGDPALLRQVLLNLIGNALKYSSTRTAPVVQVRGWDGVVETSYAVTDNGVGFDMGSVKKLFGAFQRLHSERDFPGSGIGLALVRRLIERHGGRVWAEGEPDKGATFHFSLPKAIR